MCHSRFKKPLAAMLILVMSFLQPIASMAAMVDNGQLLQQAQQRITIDELQQLMQRDDVRHQLIEMGVNPDVAAVRVASMTAEELAQLQGKLEELPAGEGVVGLVVFLFVLFVITDMLGATDVFPFVKSINK